MLTLFRASTNYLYTSYNASSHDVDFNESGIIVLGSGVYRIGSSVEFDWCSSNTVLSLKKMGKKTVVSTGIRLEKTIAYQCYLTR